MPSQEQIQMVFEYIRDSHSGDFFERISETTKGIAAVLGYLYDTSETVTAGQISKVMNVSTARVAVLLKKMENKGLIIKETGTNDARTTVVRLSELGIKNAERLHNEIYSQISRMIDRIGMERLMEFIAVSKEIRSIIKAPTIETIDKE